MPGKFQITIPLFKGGEPETIEVEFYHTVNGRTVTLSLYSPGAAEAMDMVRENIIDEEIKKYRELDVDGILPIIIE